MVLCDERLFYVQLWLNNYYCITCIDTRFRIIDKYEVIRYTITGSKVCPMHQYERFFNYVPHLGSLFFTKT